MVAGGGGRGTEPKITVCLQWTTVGANVGIFFFFLIFNCHTKMVDMMFL